MVVDLASPVGVALNVAMLGVLGVCLVVIWNARRSVGLLVLAAIVSFAIAGVMVPFFAIGAAFTVTVTDRRAHLPQREHVVLASAILRHFRGRTEQKPTDLADSPLR